jgi:hypothetical protein
MAAEVRQARPSDIPQLLALQHDCYPTLSTIAVWGESHLKQHMTVFPEGQVIASKTGRIVGHSASFRIKSEVAMRPHTFREITAAGTFSTHDPQGDALYGAEIMVHPDVRRMGIAGRFYEYRFDLMRRLGIRYFIAGGRIPGYGAVKDTMSPADYVAEVVSGYRADRVLTPQLRSGLRVHAVLPNYLNDPNSDGFATLLVKDLIASPPKKARTRGRART